MLYGSYRLPIHTLLKRYSYKKPKVYCVLKLIENALFNLYEAVLGYLKVNCESLVFTIGSDDFEITFDQQLIPCTLV